MCGIWAIFGVTSNLHHHCSETFTKIRRRGPDAWRVEYDDRLKNCCVGFHRLSIVDSIYGMQPMKLHQYPNCLLICNGELYNCKRLSEQFDFNYETKSDVECILHLYNKFGIDFCLKSLDGVFAFCIIDIEKKKVLLGRDPYGVRPLFKYTNDSGTLGISSEAKGLTGIDSNDSGSVIEPFKPGTFEEYDISDTGKVKLVRSVKYFKPGDKPAFKPFLSYDKLETNDHLGNIRKLLTSSVNKRLMADRRIGCLLSGGLDSSLIAGLLVQEAKLANIPYKIQSFSIGMRESPDLKSARLVAKHLGTDHHEIIFDVNDIESILDEVIYTLETPDITTIRASIPMYLLSKYVVQNTNTTVLLSGEGADEVAQGYIYFRDAPNAHEAHDDSIRLLNEIYMFDGLRADRTISSQSLELRVPFLDLQFTNYYLNINHELKQPKNGVEKYLLRAAFDGLDLIPNEILWRSKEAFSDGVASNSKSLFVILQEIIDKRMPEVFDIEESISRYPHCTPTTKEAFYYRTVFEKSYKDLAPKFLPHFWMPRWVEGVTDPSARFIKHYDADK